FHEGSLEPEATICWHRPSWASLQKAKLIVTNPWSATKLFGRSILFRSMADSNEPQEDAVRLKPPLPIAGKPPDMKMPETVQMPRRDDRDAVSNQFFLPANPSAAKVTTVADSVPL